MPVLTLAAEMLKRMDAYWRAANHLSVGHIYLNDNPLLKTLQDAFHRLRQSGIDKELFDVVSGFEALAGSS